ncbi:MAG: beta-hydroxylase [Piscirickettsiaceae bacterium]|nr:beta-hydroxylase [Piscirickettsiaceae bacterium]
MTILQQEKPHPITLKIRVSAPARLHLGFLDLNGEAGRKFGSIGLAINSHNTVIEVEPANSLIIAASNVTISASLENKIKQIVASFYTTLGQHIPLSQQGVKLSLIELIPSHAGLGSGTQLALTIGTLLCRLHNLSANTADIAFHLGRGARSGIGIATFDHGGFIVDGGLNSTAQIPPLLARYDLPSSWRIIMIMDHNNQGVHGSEELHAFTHLPTFPLAHSQTICHLTLMKLLPALVENDIDSFGQAITEIQALIGDHFSPTQGGRYTSVLVAQLLHYAQSLGHTGIAQSSWGPTGCIFVDGDSTAQKLIGDLTQYCQQEKLTTLSLSMTDASSSGAKIEISSNKSL